MVLNRKRSSCASGSGYVPSSSIGFCVARTKNGALMLYLMAAHRAGKLLHGFEQRRLRLGRRAVDFVRQQDVGKDRARNKSPGAMAGGSVLFDDVGSGDVGRHQIGRELDALENQAQRLGQRANQQSLRGSRQAGDQAVAADEERNEHLLDHFFLSDDHFLDFPHDALANLLEAVNPFLEFRRVGNGCAQSGHVFILRFPTVVFAPACSPERLQETAAPDPARRLIRLALRSALANSKCAPA